MNHGSVEKNMAKKYILGFIFIFTIICFCLEYMIYDLLLENNQFHYIIFMFFLFYISGFFQLMTKLNLLEVNQTCIIIVMSLLFSLGLLKLMLLF